MSYSRNYGLSADAEAAFAQIAKGLIAKAQREKRIPEEYRFWCDTNAPEINEELQAKGVIRYAFTDPQGLRVYSHTPNAEALKHALGWTQN